MIFVTASPLCSVARQGIWLICTLSLGNYFQVVGCGLN